MPSWNDLPEKFKNNLVEYLDFKSRIHLSSCSKNEYGIINCCPWNLEFLEIRKIRKTEKIGISLKPEFFFENTKFYTLDFTEKLLNRIFMNPISKIEYFELTFDENPKNFLDNLPENLKIRKIQFNGSNFNFTFLLEFLKKTDSNFLESLNFRAKISTNQWNQLISSDQWSRLKELRYFRMHQLPIEGFLKSFEKFTIFYYFLTPINAGKIIENFKNRNLPVGSGFFRFFIETCYCIDHRKILHILEIAEKPDMLDTSQEYHHTQFINLPNPNLTFVLQFGQRKIKGAVCRKNFEREDFPENDDSNYGYSRSFQPEIDDPEYSHPPIFSETRVCPFCPYKILWA